MHKMSHHTMHSPYSCLPWLKTASMKPRLTIVFFRDKRGSKFLNVTTQTQCNLGCDVNTEHYLWFQGDIKISFGVSLPDHFFAFTICPKWSGRKFPKLPKKFQAWGCEGTELKDFSASVQGGEKGELTKETTNITLGGSTSVAKLESKGMFGQGMIAYIR